MRRITDENQFGGKDFRADFSEADGPDTVE
jgi:hypothetical protein